MRETENSGARSGGSGRKHNLNGATHSHGQNCRAIIRLREISTYCNRGDTHRGVPGIANGHALSITLCIDGLRTKGKTGRGKSGRGCGLRPRAGQTYAPASYQTDDNQYAEDERYEYLQNAPPYSFRNLRMRSLWLGAGRWLGEPASCVT